MTGGFDTRRVVGLLGLMVFFGPLCWAAGITQPMAGDSTTPADRLYAMAPAEDAKRDGNSRVRSRETQAPPKAASRERQTPPPPSSNAPRTNNSQAAQDRQQETAKRDAERRVVETRQRDVTRQVIDQRVATERKNEITKQETERRAAETRKRETTTRSPVIEQPTTPRIIRRDTNNPPASGSPVTTGTSRSPNTLSGSTQSPSTSSTGTSDRSNTSDTRRRTGGQANTPDRSVEIKREIGTNKDHRDASGTGSDSTISPQSRRVPRFDPSGRAVNNTEASGLNRVPYSPGTSERSRVSEVRKRLGDSGLPRSGDSGLPGSTGSTNRKDLNDPAIIKRPLTDHPPGDHRLNDRKPGDHSPDVPQPKDHRRIDSDRPLADSGGGHRDKTPPPGVHPGHNKPPLNHGDLRKNFPDLVKAGGVDHLAVGETAKKLKLSEQYKMWPQGDVARRLDLQKHAHDMGGPGHGTHMNHPVGLMDLPNVHDHHPDFYHGWVSPMYVRHCMPYHYWGPTFFAGVCWYPRWNPWVEWSWYHRCHSYWDPRPIWCRPVIYDPSPAWVSWDIPVWTPLPAVTCGTWIDVKPVIVPADQTDLELLAVRFVDPGHPEEKLGPRYRVWFRNNCDRPVTQPFNVTLFAGNDANLAAGLPQAGVRVTAIEANDVQSVDIRLPVDVLTMGRDADGKPAPFSTLHVLVDANREVSETTRANNGVRLPPAEVLPVDPAAFELEPPTAAPGAEMILAGEGFGPEPGQVMLVVGDKEIEAEILGWYDLGVRFSLPKIADAAATEADVIVVRGDGAASNPLKIKISR